jgi:PDDEXK-like domain of unknown function (DUF3799)
MTIKPRVDEPMLRGGYLHWTDLKQIGKSPAHYRYAMQQERAMSREMRVGDAADAIVFGHKRIVVYPGKVRHGKEWDAFREKHADASIVNDSEFEEAEGAATALINSKAARDFTGGWRLDTFQIPLEGEVLGIPVKTRGVDMLDRGFGRLIDVKCTHSTEPRMFSRHAWSMDWHTQLELYADLAGQNGIEVGRVGLVGVEASPPHVVTVLYIPDDVRQQARKRLRGLFERLKSCLDANAWPGYAQDAVPMDLPSWIDAEDSEEGDRE